MFSLLERIEGFYAKFSDINTNVFGIPLSVTEAKGVFMKRFHLDCSGRVIRDSRARYHLNGVCGRTTIQNTAKLRVRITRDTHILTRHVKLE